MENAGKANTKVKLTATNFRVFLVILASKIEIGPPKNVIATSTAATNAKDSIQQTLICFKMRLLC